LVASYRATITTSLSPGTTRAQCMQRFLPISVEWAAMFTNAKRSFY